MFFTIYFPPLFYTTHCLINIISQISFQIQSSLSWLQGLRYKKYIISYILLLVLNIKTIHHFSRISKEKLKTRSFPCYWIGIQIHYFKIFYSLAESNIQMKLFSMRDHPKEGRRGERGVGLNAQ